MKVLQPRRVDVLVSLRSSRRAIIRSPEWHSLSRLGARWRLWHTSGVVCAAAHVGRTGNASDDHRDGRGSVFGLAFVVVSDVLRNVEQYVEWSSCGSNK